MERLIRHAATLEDCGHPVALVGDFNVVPTDFDIYNPASAAATREPDAYERLLAQGLDGCPVQDTSQDRIHTFWDYFRDHWKRDAGLRIDHLLLNRTLAPRLRKAGVDRWVRDLPKASDHAPVWVTLAPWRACRELPCNRTSVSSRSPRGARRLLDTDDRVGFDPSRETIHDCA